MIEEQLVKDLKKALFLTWVIISIFSFLALLIPFFDQNQRVPNNIPTCISIQKYGKKCILCGSTRAYYLISKNQLKDAWEMNSIAVGIYILSLINSIGLLVILLRKFIKSQAPTWLLRS